MTFKLFDLTILLRAIRVEIRDPFSVAKELMSTVALYSSRARQRRQLLQLSDHVLLDIGVTREEAMIEANKPFWKN